MPIADPGPTVVGYTALGLLIYLFVMGAFGHYISSMKNRSLGEALTFAFILGPLGLILLAMLPDNRVPTIAEENAAASARLRR